MPNPKTAARWLEILLKQGIVDELSARSVQSSMAKWGWSLARAVGDLGVTDEETVVEMLAGALRLPSMTLGNLLRDNGALRALGPDFCEKHLVFPVTLKDKALTLAMADPTDLDALDQAASLASGARVQVVMAAETQIRAAIARHYRGQDLTAARRKTASGVKPDPRLKEQLQDLDRRRSAAAAAPAGPAFSAEERQRLEAAQQTQAKVSHILKTVQDLLAEKGY